MFKRFMAMLLVVVLIFTTSGIEAYAAKTTLIEVTRDNAPLRGSSSEKGKVIARFEEGRVLETVGSVRNRYWNKWYKVWYEGDLCYIYSGNVKTHKCDFESITYNGMKYEYCDCGKVSVTNLEETGKDTTQLSSFVGTAGTLALMDGPAPFGDYAAVAVLFLSGFCLLTGLDADVAVQSLDLSGVDLDRYLEENSGVCGLDSYRRVSRVNGKLTYTDDECMDIAQAFLYVYVLNGDVYTQTEEAARALASMYKSGCYSERDKDKPSYFYHYHLGKNAKEKVGGHIFYGSNEYGESPQ